MKRKERENICRQVAVPGSEILSRSTLLRQQHSSPSRNT